MKKKIIISIIVIAIVIISAIFVVNKIQEENRKYEIAQISEYNYFILKEDNKYGVINKKGEKIIDAKYDDIKIPNPEKSVFICYEGDTTTVLNNKGEKIYTQYQNIQPLKLKNVLSDLMYEKTTLKYSKDDKYGIIDIDGKKITDAIYDDIDTLQFKEGELLVKQDGKEGIINIKGTMLVKSQYDGIEADKYYEENTGYKKDGYITKETTEEGYRYGYINTKGKKILENKYNELYRITDINSEDAYIICAENGKYGLSKNGKQIIKNDYQALTYNESNNTITALSGKNYGVISIEGKEIVPFGYKQIDISGEYIYGTTADGTTKVFDSKGNETNIESSTAIVNVKNTDYKIYINTTKDKTNYKIYKDDKELTKKEYTYMEYLYDNYFIACDSNGKLGVIDDGENIKIKFDYNSIQKIEGMNLLQTIKNENNEIDIYTQDLKEIVALSNSSIEQYKEYIKIYNDDEVKYITKDGKEVKNTELLKNNKIFAIRNGKKWGFADANGNIVVECKYDDVTEVNDYGFAGIKINNEWGIINSEGKIIVDPKYKINENNPTFIGEYYKVTYGSGENYYTK